jgi:hypothetical protein
MVSRETSKIRYCTFCTTGHHKQCNGQAPAMGGTCECADRDHNPSVEVAAAMRRYHHPEPFNTSLPVEALATEYRKITAVVR